MLMKFFLGNLIFRHVCLALEYRENSLELQSGEPHLKLLLVFIPEFCYYYHSKLITSERCFNWEELVKERSVGIIISKHEAVDYFVGPRVGYFSSCQAWLPKEVQRVSIQIQEKLQRM